MKPSLWISMFLVAALPQAQAAETAAAPTLVSDAATGVARAAFDDRELFLAEVELSDPQQHPELPEWLAPYVVREVTNESEYVNLNLAR